MPSDEVIEAQQEAAAGMQVDAGASAGGAVGKVGRNDPCPCGSGRKYKKCHGKVGEDGPPVPTGPGAAPVAKVGKNKPCPCGSGRKYKQCHGKA
jgi:uncharacterized protein YecA (UPF0149 family)